MKQLFYSFIYPYLYYCLRVWGGANVTHRQKLIILQKKALRIINKQPYLAHTSNLFFHNGILKLDDLYKLKVGIYMFENRNIDQFRSTHVFNTRHRSNLVPVFQRLGATQNSITFMGPKIWNEIPADIRDSHSNQSFKLKFKNYLLSLYSPTRL